MFAGAPGCHEGVRPLETHLWGFFTPPVAGADLRAALVASCLRGALPPVDLRAVCLVRAMMTAFWWLLCGRKCVACGLFGKFCKSLAGLYARC